MNPMLKYPGSKWRISDWIISFFPKHEVYLEPFFGTMSCIYGEQNCPFEHLSRPPQSWCYVYVERI